LSETPSRAARFNPPLRPSDDFHQQERETMPRATRPERATSRKPTGEFVERKCKFCEDQIVIDFTQTDLLKKHMTETGRILPARFTGNCSFHQRRLTTAIKRARSMLLVR
jgi:small subunit ribosomal protein S18